MTAKTQNQLDEPSKQPLQPEKLNPIVYRILNEADPELAGYYLGAHKTLEDTSNPERFPSAAHSLRELIEKLPDKHKRGVQIERPPSILSDSIYAARDAWALVAIDKTNQNLWQLPISGESNRFLRKSDKFWEWFTKHYPKRDEQRLKFIQEIHKGTPLPPALQEKQLEQWGEYAGRFAKIAHHREKPEDFHQLLSKFEDFLIRELDPQTTKDFARVTKLIKEFEAGNKKGNAELLRLVRSNRPNYDHFFFSISSPAWLKVLEENQLVDHIDDPIRTEEGGYMLLTWVPGQYYEKIAAQEPVKVASIITSLPKTENARVHEQVVEIAKKMPKKHAVCIVPLLPEWIKGKFSVGRGLLPFKVGEYIVELARMGAYDEAIEVFRALFELQPPPETNVYFRHPETLTSDTSYKTILKETVPSLLELNPEGTIKELCDLLESGLKIEERDNNTEKNGIIYDGSSIWRPDIRKQEYDHEPNPILVSRIYTSIISYAKTSEQKLAVIKILTSYKFEIFHRIAATIAEGEKDPALKKIYDELVEKVEPSKPDFIVREDNVVPAVSLDDMKKLSPDELIKLLNEWDPKEDFPGFGRSKSDIGHVLSQYVQENPALLKQLFENKNKLNVEYYNYLFRGIRLASDTKQVVVNWEPVLKYGREFLEASDTTNSEGDERQAQFNLLNAVESGVNHDHIKVTSPALAEDILAIITPLCSHVEPSAEDEATRDKNGRFDSVGLAINTMRGEALSGLIALLKNVSRNGKKLKEKPLAPEQRKGIYELLEKHLDIRHEATMAVRTVFARELPFLAYDNQAWIKKNLDKIFPRDKKQDKYFVDAMEAFLQFTKPFPEVFPLVVPYVIEYMKRVQAGTIKGGDDTTINHVVGQILLLYIDNFVELDDPVMDELFKMPDDYLEEAMDFFGRGIKQTSGDRQKLILQKAKDYWQKRLDSGSTRKAEYSKFGWWLRVSAADDWIKQRFSQALEETDQMDALYFMADEIVEIAKTDEAGAATALLEIVDTQHKDNLINMLHAPELRDTLKALLESKETNIRDSAVRVIDKLCNMGFYNFKELLEEEPTPSKS
jgi:hypothetical protein